MILFCPILKFIASTSQNYRGEETNPIEKIGLLEMEDPMEVCKTSVIPVSLRLDSNPLIDQTPARILEREYEVNIGVITIGTSDSVFSSYKPMTEPAFELAVSSFRYLRFKRVVYRVVSVTTPYVWGFIYGVILPDGGTRSVTLVQDYGWLSHENTTIMDVTNETEMQISAPWTLPQSWVDLEDVTSFNQIMMFWYQLTIFSYLGLGGRVATTASLDIPVKIYARLEGVEVAGPVDARGSLRRKTKVEAQSLLMAGASYVGGEVVKQVSKKMFSGVEQAVDQGIEYASNYVSQTVEGYTLQGVEVGPPIGVVKNDSKGDGNMEVIPSIYGSMLYSDTRHVLASGTIRYPGKTTSIYEYMRVPSLIKIGQISTSSIGLELNPFAADRDAANCSRIKFIGQMFRRWRGGIQYTILFPSSNFISYRVNVSFNYSVDQSLIAGDVPTKVVSVHGTTRVSFFVPYLFPNLWCEVDSSIRMGTLTLALTDGQTPKTVGDVAPTCPFMLYECPGNDFQFNSLQEFGPVFDPGVEAQSTVMQMAGTSPFCGSHPGSLQSVDDVCTFEGIMERWSFRYGQSTDPRPMNFGAVTARIFGSGIFDQLARVFLLWRGQMKFKILYSSLAADEPQNVTALAKYDNNKQFSHASGIPDAYRFGDGIRMINLRETQVIDYVVPFVSNTEWQPMDQSVPYSVEPPSIFSVHLDTFNTTTSPTVLMVAVAAGKDFLMTYAVPPPCSALRPY